MFDPKATYIATASHPETENVDSNELCVHKRGSVNLHFLRHGMLRDYGNEEENYFNYIKS